MENRKDFILSINPCTYGMNYHDPSVAIFNNGKIVAAIEEERTNGIKGSKGIFPIESIKECMRIAKITPDLISTIAISYNPSLWNNRFRLEMDAIFDKCKFNHKINYEKLMEDLNASNMLNRWKFFNDKTNAKEIIKLKSNVSCDNIKFYDHHLCHIASSYFASGFKSALGVVVDGIGESATTTIWRIKNNNFEKILEVDYPNSLGYFYATATEFLGFKSWEEEGKLMALAPYGKKDKKIIDDLKKIINLNNPIYNVSKFIYKNRSNYLMLNLDNAIDEIQKITGIKRRFANEKITQEHKNFAYAAQNILENSVINLINYGLSLTGESNVCVAGGVFMNCKMNMAVREKSKATKYFVQPLAGDAGTVIGAGLLASNSINIYPFTSLSFGSEYSNDEIERTLVSAGVNYQKSCNIAKDVAQLLSKKMIVCWFQGKMEMGARALGNRSILADPRGANTSDIINERVKHREKWRPFACSVLDNQAQSIFENYRVNNKYPFMIEAFKVKKEWIDKIPAVVHKADYTSRPQTVNKKDYPLYYEMIYNFYKITGCPLVLNTSFNDKGQPIVRTPELALEFFLKNDVDALAIGNYIVFKDKSKYE